MPIDDTMSYILCRDEGVGLAAPQVGVNVRLMVFNPEGPEARGQKQHEMILVNPRIVSSSKSTALFQEGCLSFQDLARDKHINGDVEVSCVCAASTS